MQNVQCSYPFGELFQETGKDAKAAVEVPNLRSDCQAWIKCTHAQVKSVVEFRDEAVGDDVDRALDQLSSAVGDGEDEGDNIRKQANAKLDAVLQG